MGIRIQPKEIEISDNPKDDPFKNDLLKRKESIEILTQLIRSIEGSGTIAVDSSWGTGKTTFIKLWRQYLINNKFTVISFNAWENDFYNDPFTALCAELSAVQDSSIDKNKLMEAGEEVIKHFAWNVSSQIIAAMSAGTVNLSELTKAYETAITKRLKQYQDAKEAISKFRETLQAIAATALSEDRNSPLIVIIDELDRCRPSYAVELLEVVKYLFSVNNIVFVLAINRSELAHSVKVLYGSDFDATGYLRRFFNLIYQLPKPDTSDIDRFISGALNHAGIDACFKQRDPQFYVRENDVSAYKLLRTVFGTLNFSLREIAQEVHRLGLVVATLPDNQLLFLRSAVVAIILKMYNEELYYQFIGGDINDKDLVERLCEDEMFKKLKQTNEGWLFEAILIMAYKEIHNDSDNINEALKYKTPLESTYESGGTVGKASHMMEFGEKVLGRVKEFELDTISYHDYRLGFIHSVNRLEFLDKNLIGNE